MTDWIPAFAGMTDCIGLVGVKNVRPVGQELEGVVRVPAEGLEQRGLKEGALFLLHACGQPAQAAEHVEQAAQVCGRLFDASE